MKKDSLLVAVAVAVPPPRRGLRWQPGPGGVSLFPPRVNFRPGEASMTTPDFGSYSLAMFCGEERIFMSREPGLKPLAEWLDIFRGRHRNCLLHDRVVGLAAARLIAYSGLVAAVTARVASWPARRFLGGEGISLHAEQMVDSILTEDRTAVCPEEVIAIDTPDRDEYLKRIYRLIGYDPLEYEHCRGQCGYTPWCRECMKSRGLL